MKIVLGRMIKIGKSLEPSKNNSLRNWRAREKTAQRTCLHFQVPEGSSCKLGIRFILHKTNDNIKTLGSIFWLNIRNFELSEHLKIDSE